MIVRTRGIVALLVGAALVDGVAVLLTITAFHNVGQALYRHHHIRWGRVAIPLILAQATSALASLLAATGGMYASVRLRTRVLSLALQLDPDITRLWGAGRAHAVALDAELVGSLLVTSAPSTLLGLTEVTAGLSVLLENRTRVGDGIVAIIAVVGILGAAMLLARRRAAWSESRARINDALVQRVLGLRTVLMQERPEDARRIGAELAGQYRRRSIVMDASQLALASGAFVYSAAFVITAAELAPTGSGTAIAIGAALLTGIGFTKVCVGAADMVNARDAYRRVRALADARGDGPHAPEAHAGVDGPLVTARDLTFRYEPSGGLVRPVDLTVHAGDRILLSGASGSGKTTLGELLVGRRVPTTGTVSVGKGVRVVRVPQAGDDYVFHASLLFNVVCAEQWPPTDDEAQRAVDLLIELGLGPMLKRMPSGIAQPVGEGGWRLSAGEAARVSVARALYVRPDVVVLDESTAPLDPITKKLVLAVTERHSKATVVIAHD
jgi:ATP-binding cassette subfamily B protein